MGLRHQPPSLSGGKERGLGRRPKRCWLLRFNMGGGVKIEQNTSCKRVFLVLAGVWGEMVSTRPALLKT